MIASLQNEVCIFLQLAAKVDKSKLDYRPTPNSAAFGNCINTSPSWRPPGLSLASQGSREAKRARWGAAEAASKKMILEQAVVRIEKQSERLGDSVPRKDGRRFCAVKWNYWGRNTRRGCPLVTLVLCRLAA